MMRIEIDRRSIDAALTRLSPEKFSRVMRAAMNESVAYVEHLVVPAIPENTGTTRGSVFTDVRGTAAGMTGIVGTPAKHAIVLEHGRRPGGKFPPREEIALWAKRRLGVTDPGIVFLIRRKIAQKGTKALHMFENARKRGAGQVGKIIAKHFRTAL
jgi:hypothetical protein